MNTFETMSENITELENQLLNPDQKTKDMMFKAMFQYFETNEIWEAIIVAGEMSLIGIDVKSQLNDEQRSKMVEELQSLRDKAAKDEDPYLYIDLARCIYRFKNIGINFPDLNTEEMQKLQNLPDTIRNDKEWPKDHLAYIPQIANAINQDVNSLKQPNDAITVRQELEQDIAEKENDDKQFHSMIIGGGLLAQFDNNQAIELFQSKAWKNGKQWPEILDYFKKISQEENGWQMARLLPPMQTLIKLYRLENSN